MARLLDRYGPSGLAWQVSPTRGRSKRGHDTLSNFFERRVSAYQVAVSGSVSFDSDF
jgi:hypothetical protein